MSNVVMTGRRTKGPVRLIRPPPLTAAAAAAALAAAGHRPCDHPPLPLRAPPAVRVAVGAAKAHRRVRRETQLSFRHDAIALVNAARDDRRARRPCARRPPRADAPCPPDRPRTRTSRAGRDDRLLRHDERVFLIEQMERGRRELPGPETTGRVVERRLELHGAGRRIDRVVDERQLARHRSPTSWPAAPRCGAILRTLRAGHSRRRAGTAHRRGVAVRRCSPRPTARRDHFQHCHRGVRRDGHRRCRRARHAVAHRVRRLRHRLSCERIDRRSRRRQCRPAPPPPADHPWRRTGARAEAATTEPRNARRSDAPG